jgi:hypothetical protein
VNTFARFALLGGASPLLLALAAAQRPAVFAGIERGLWEVRGAPGSAPQRLCVAQPAILAQFEHRSSKCTREVVRDTPTVAEVHYRCAGAGFGQSIVSQVTPRSLRIETQGISGGAPFHYVLQARRVGSC